MAWDDDKDKNPWGGGKPPEINLDELIKKFLENFNKKFGGNFKSFLPGASILVILAIALWAFTGVYIVQPGEIAVVKRFGKVVNSVGEGPHWHIPYPFESSTKLSVDGVRRVETGFKTVRQVPTAEYRKIPKESLMLTGDKNIVDIEFIVQYKIKDAIEFLYNVKNPDGTVKDAAEAAMREIIGKENIDEVLTVGKSRIQRETKIVLQDILDKYKTGIVIDALQLQDVTPPQQVVNAFKDVQSAREDREKAINEAQGYRNDILPKAKGEASNILNKAIAYKESKKRAAEGETSRYLQTLAEYSKAKDVTRKRLYIEAMEEITANADKVIISKEASKQVLPYLPLNKRGE